ncbi:hypothetical protein F5Y04DRAFT_290295 [Hypomontagnella monticulosa]|nr:hypothetical protein F5Y04DRAFT_290295 [Hypomontagnella monticulosa]
MAQPSNGEAPTNEKPSWIKDHVIHHRQHSILFEFLGRWLLTALICAAFVIVLKQYDQKVYFQSDSTHVYNAVAAGLTICLSLNIDSSLNAFASTFKWAILVRRHFKPRVFELILAFDSSKINAIKLLFWPSGSPWWLRIICLVWLLIAVLAQVGTALIGLTYSVASLSPNTDDFPRPRGDGYTAIFTQIGSISVDNEDTSNPTEAVQRSNAFGYGFGTINAEIQFWPTLIFRYPTWDSETEAYYSGISNYPAWANDGLTLWNTIGRSVENYANCTDAQITDMSVDSNATIITFNVDGESQVFTVLQNPLDYVTYISDTSPSCGPRCTQVYAIFSANETTNLFMCNSTVGEMYDDYTGELVLQQNLSMPDTQARILAGSIGWGDINVNSSLDPQSIPDRFQASGFPSGSYWAPSSRPDSATMSALFVARFPAAAIAAMNEGGIMGEFPDLSIPGVAQQLDVQWTYSILTLSLIPGIQAIFTLMCIALLYLHPLPIHDSSPFAIAKLLAPVVSHIPQDTLASGSEIAKKLTMHYVYTYNVVEYEIKVGIGEQST